MKIKATIIAYFAIFFVLFALPGCGAPRYPDIPIKDALEKYSYAELESNPDLLNSIVDDPRVQFKLSTDRKIRRDQILTFAKLSDGVKAMDKESNPTEASKPIAEAPQPVTEIRAEEASQPVVALNNSGKLTGARLPSTPIDNSPIHDLLWKSEDNTYFEYINNATNSTEYYISAKGNAPTYIADCELSSELMGNGNIMVAGYTVEPMTPETCAGGRAVITRGFHYDTAQIAVEIRVDGKLVYANTYYHKSL